ncbi:hypothetical protein AmDm5_1431 [Acetobacter malorum]|nr:hypothetical protein AmDm5_1431 [Acetobacter malorum]
MKNFYGVIDLDYCAKEKVKFPHEPGTNPDLNGSVCRSVRF